MAVIRSMWTDIPAHEVATVMMNTGSPANRQAMPRFLGGLRIRFREPKHARIHFPFVQVAVCRREDPQNWQSAFLPPGVYQGTSVNTQAPSVEVCSDDSEYQKPVYPAGGTTEAVGSDSATQRNPCPKLCKKMRCWRRELNHPKLRSRCKPRLLTPLISIKNQRQ